MSGQLIKTSLRSRGWGRRAPRPSVIGLQRNLRWEASSPGPPLNPVTDLSLFAPKLDGATGLHGAQRLVAIAARGCGFGFVTVMVWALRRYWKQVPCQKHRGQCQECYGENPIKTACFDRARQELQQAAIRASGITFTSTSGRR